MATLTPTLLGQAAVPFYFVTAGNGLSVSVSVVLNDGITVSVPVSYNIAGFNSPFMSATQPNLFKINMYTGCPGYSPAPYMMFGNTVGPISSCPGWGHVTGTAGISFSNTTIGTPSGGAFSFVQLITADSRSYTYPPPSQLPHLFEHWP